MTYFNHGSPKFLIVGALCSLAALGIGTYLLFKSPAEKVEIFPPPVVKQAPADQITDDLKLDAMLRAHVIDNICIDKKLDAMFAHIADHPHVEKWMDQGWYIVEKTTFVQLENNTVMLRSESEWDKVFPNVNGLLCKQQVVDPSWVKD